MIHNWLLPHLTDGLPPMQSPEDFWAVCRIKAIQLCMMVGDIIRVVLGFDAPTNKDRTANRRYESPGSLLGLPFSLVFLVFVFDC